MSRVCNNTGVGGTGVGGGAGWQSPPNIYA